MDDLENTPQEDYYFSMNKVYKFIDDHLDGDLSLSNLSQLSGFSPFHFHRLFHALTGQTLHDYVLERRVIKSASRMLYDRNTITQIALDCGFSSSSHFHRCFKKIVGCSPSNYRRNKERKRPILSKGTKPKLYSSVPALDSLFKISDLPNLHVAGIYSRGLSSEFKSKDVEESFRRLFTWLKKSHLVKKDLPVIGITMDNPEVVQLSDCRYFACVPVDRDVKSKGEIIIQTFPTEGKYINFSLQRSDPGFAQTFIDVTDYLYGRYMPIMDLLPDSRPFIEIYSQRKSAIHISFHIPIR